MNDRDKLSGALERPCLEKGLQVWLPASRETHSLPSGHKSGVNSRDYKDLFLTL